MKKSIIFLIFLLSYAYVDLGVQGQLYPIAENNNSFITLLEKSYKNNKKQIKKEILTSIDKAFIYKINIPISNKDKNITEIDYSILQADIYNPYTKEIIKHKGEKVIVPMPQGITESFCALDGNWDSNTTKKILKELGKCNFYLITNKDIRKWAKKYNKYNVYPYREDIAKRWKIDKIPIKIILFDKYRKKIYLNYYKFKDEK